MARTNNRDVINRFVNHHEDGLNGYGNVKSRADTLYSYRATIAEWVDGTLVVNAGWDGYSPTTSKHMKFLYDAVTGNTEAYGYRRDDFTTQDGYDSAESVVPLRVTTEGKGHMKPRWRGLETETETETPEADQ